MWFRVRVLRLGAKGSGCLGLRWWDVWGYAEVRGLHDLGSAVCGKESQQGGLAYTYIYIYVYIL